MDKQDLLEIDLVVRPIPGAVPPGKSSLLGVTGSAAVPPGVDPLGATGEDVKGGGERSWTCWMELLGGEANAGRLGGP